MACLLALTAVEADSRVVRRWNGMEVDGRAARMVLSNSSTRDGFRTRGTLFSAPPRSTSYGGVAGDGAPDFSVGPSLAIAASTGGDSLWSRASIDALPYLCSGSTAGLVCLLLSAAISFATV